MAVALGVLGSALVLPSNDAYAVATVRFIYAGGNIAVISGDGCSLKPVKLTTAKNNVRRDFQCVTKSTKPSTATSGTIVAQRPAASHHLRCDLIRPTVRSSRTRARRTSPVKFCSLARSLLS